jgi:hypothetical protein
MFGCLCFYAFSIIFLSRFCWERIRHPEKQIKLDQLHRNSHQTHITVDSEKRLTPNYKKQELHSHMKHDDCQQNRRSAFFFLFQATHICVGKVENMHIINYMQHSADGKHAN